MNPAGGLDLAQLLSAAVLIAITCEYEELLRRREQRRRADKDRLASEAAGLRGLVRVLLADTSARATAATNPLSSSLSRHWPAVRRSSVAGEGANGLIG
jgi:hypothetical protein